MPRKSSVRFGIILFGTVFLLGFSGCMATESQQGETYIYKYSFLLILLLLAVAVTLIGFGVAFIREGLKTKAPRKGKRSSKPGKRREAQPSSVGGKFGTIAFGAVLGLGGALVLFLGVPNSLARHITITPDTISMEKLVSWSSRETDEFPTSSLVKVDKIEHEVPTRRGTRKEETMLLRTNDATKYIKMGPIEKAAYSKLAEIAQANRDRRQSQGESQQLADQSQEATPPIRNVSPRLDPANVAQNQAFSEPVNPDPVSPSHSPFGQRPTPTPNAASTPIDESKLTPVTHIGRLFNGGEVMVGALGTSGANRAHIVEIYAEGKVKLLASGGKPGEELLVDVANVRPTGGMYVPREFGPGTPIDQANPPVPGTKLLAFHAGRWFEAEFVRMQGTRPVIQWPGERGLLIATTNGVRIPPPEGTKLYDGKRYNPPTDEGLTPIEERGPYAAGKEVYFHEGAMSRMVVVLQWYREQVAKVQDAETGQELYVLRTELRTSP